MRRGGETQSPKVHVCSCKLTVSISEVHSVQILLQMALRQGCARDLLSRDRDETRDPCLRNRDETETFKILSETRPRRDVTASETLAETLKLPGALTSRRDVFRDVW